LGRSIESLPVAERARHYRESAEAAFKLAEGASSEGLKGAYLNVATGWHTMALELELALRSDSIFESLFDDPHRPRGP
jgi:hypothetical protein